MFKKRLLDNGVPVVMEQMRNLRSVSLGVWVRVGARNELPEESGISHFLEHMFFKGTRKRSANDIASEIDSLGGDLNAFTSKESTTFYVKVLSDYLTKGTDLLMDIFLHSTFPEAEIEKEKGVIREEIKMVEDTPDDYVHEIFNESIWGNAGLGQPILGRRETIRSLTRRDLMGHIKKYYGTKDTVVACAGRFDEEELLGTLNRSLGGLRRGSETAVGRPQDFRVETKVVSKDLAEVHICLGVRGIKQASPDRYCMLLLNTIFGGGLSSRLFQEIREKRGLAYTVYSFLSSYRDTGLWAVYAGTGRKKVVEVLERTVGELRRLPETLSEAEIQRAKSQLKGNLILGLESTNRMMQNIANQEIYFGRNFSPREIMREIDSISLKRARELSERLIKGNRIALTVLGPAEAGLLKGFSPLL